VIQLKTGVLPKMHKDGIKISLSVYLQCVDIGKVITAESQCSRLQHSIKNYELPIEKLFKYHIWCG